MYAGSRSMQGLSGVCEEIFILMVPVDPKFTASVCSCLDSCGTMRYPPLNSTKTMSQVCL